MEATRLLKATTEMVTAATMINQTARTCVGGVAPRSQRMPRPRDDMLRGVPRQRATVDWIPLEFGLRVHRGQGAPDDAGRWGFVNNEFSWVGECSAPPAVTPFAAWS